MTIISLNDNANRLGLSDPATASMAAPPAVGTRTGAKLLGIWRLGERIHCGLHSQLWLAQPADSMGSPRWEYVLKTVPRELCESVDRAAATAQLRRFADVAAVARHPHLVAVVDAAPLASDPFLVMPRLTGQSLADVLAAGAVQPLPVVLWWIRQVTSACAALHESGFIHGDINPGNVRVSPQGHVTLVDLGLACRIGHCGEANIRGSVAYAAPQRLVAELPAAAASDMFSLGRLLWQLLSLTVNNHSGASIEPVADLITDLVHPDPTYQPSAERLASQLMRLEIETLGQHIRPHQQAASRKAA